MRHSGSKKREKKKSRQEKLLELLNSNKIIDIFLNILIFHEYDKYTLEKLILFS